MYGDEHLAEEGCVTTGNGPSDLVAQLRHQRDECQRTADRIDAELGGPPPLRERNWFFHQLLNSDLDTYDRVRTLWLERRRSLRMVRKLNRRMTSAARTKVADEPGYRELGTKAGQEKDVKRAGTRLLGSIRKARKRVEQAAKGDSSHSALKRDARDIERALRAVHRNADGLPATLSRGSLDSGELAKLRVRFRNGDAPEERKKQYAELRTALGSLERTANSLVREVGEREKKFKAKQRQYMRDGQARYNR
jgi:hypothetical protein